MAYDLFEIKTFWFLKNSEGKFLFMYNNHEDSIIKGYVNPPAGHMDAGETLHETVKREVKEELDITKINNILLRGVVNVVGFKDNPVLLLVITADVPDDQTPIEKEEGVPMWLTIEELGNHKTFEDVGEILGMLEKTPKNEVFHARSVFKDKKMISFTAEPTKWNQAKKED